MSNKLVQNPRKVVVGFHEDSQFYNHRKKTHAASMDSHLRSLNVFFGVVPTALNWLLNVVPVCNSEMDFSGPNKLTTEMAKNNLGARESMRIPDGVF